MHKLILPEHMIERKRRLSLNYYVSCFHDLFSIEEGMAFINARDLSKNMTEFGIAKRIGKVSQYKTVNRRNEKFSA